MKLNEQHFSETFDKLPKRTIILEKMTERIYEEIPFEEASYHLRETIDINDRKIPIYELKTPEISIQQFRVDKIQKDITHLKRLLENSERELIYEKGKLEDMTNFLPKKPVTHKWYNIILHPRCISARQNKKC